MFAHMPTTVEGAKLLLTQQQEEHLHVVYRKTSDQERAYFSGFWNPETDYSDDQIIVPLRSIYDGVTAPLPIGTTFANVEGSTKDPKHKESSWIQLLRDNLPSGDVTSCCAEKDRIYVGNSQDGSDAKTKDFHCNDSLVGGHVILWATNSSRVDTGENVHLLPICGKHNTFYYTGTGAGYYMKLARKMSAVKLKSYFQLSALITES